VPLESKGLFLIHWLKKLFDESFKSHLGENEGHRNQILAYQPKKPAKQQKLYLLNN